MSPNNTTTATTTKTVHQSISIFEIPLILDLICAHLSKHHLQPCLQVSHLWHDLFRPQFLRYVRFADLTPHQTWTVLNHSPRRIRSLKIDIADASLFINPPTPLESLSSNNGNQPWIENKNNDLQVLHCVGFGRDLSQILSSGIPYSLLDLSLEDQAKSALLLIQSSPHLHTLLIDHMPLANAISHFTLPVFKTISQHRTLATIKMHVPFASRIFLTNVVNSLPEGIQELDLCFENSWNFRQTSPYFEIPATERPLPALERICLRGLHQRVDSHWYLDHNYPQQHKQQQSPTPISLSPQHETFCLTYVDTMVLPLLQRTPHLCHLILRKYDSGLRDLLQNLAIYCPNLITLELSTHNAGEMYWSPTGMFNSDTSSQLAVQGSFAHLKEFRVEGEWSDLTFRMMAGLVARSKDTLEIAWFDRRNWEDLGNSWMYNAWTGDLEDSWHEDTPRDTGEDQQEDDDDGALTIDHPFYISNKVNWTHCTRLKELVIYKPEGYLLSGDDNHHPDLFLPTSSTSPTSSPSAASGATGEYPSTFNQLEKLRLSIGDVKWQGGPGGYHSEQGLTESTSSSHQRRLQGQEKREHQLGFILQVRNLFGFLKTYYPRLQYLNIEWSVHPLIQDMSLDYAMRLFCQTERDEISDNSSNMDGWCWWGKVTEQDLDWLCLPWSSQSTLIQSTVSANMTAACKQQYANKSQFLMAPSDSKTTTSDFRNNSNDNESWPLGDIYTCRVGRAWKDNLMLPTCTDLWRFRRYTRRDGMDCVWRALGHYSYGYPTVKSTTTMCSCDWSTELEYAAEGLTLTKESYRSGKKRIMRGATSYRQSVIGKHNQIK